MKPFLALVAILALLAMHDLCVAQNAKQSLPQNAKPDSFYDEGYGEQYDHLEYKRHYVDPGPIGLRERDPNPYSGMVKEYVIMNADMAAGTVRFNWRLTAYPFTTNRNPINSNVGFEWAKIKCTKLLSFATLKGNASKAVEEFSASQAISPKDTDDASILAWALNLMEKEDPRFHLQGFQQTFGNNDVDSATYVLRVLMESKGWSRDSAVSKLWRKGHQKLLTPVGASALETIVYKHDEPIKYVYKPGYEEAVALRNDLEYDATACINDAVIQLVKSIKTSPAKPNIVLSGPATDMACALRNFPEIKPLIKHVLFEGGRPWNEPLYLCNGTKGDPNVICTCTKNEVGWQCPTGTVPDLNFFKNPFAVKELLESGLSADQMIFMGVPIVGDYGTVVPFDTLMTASEDHCDSPSREFLVVSALAKMQVYNVTLAKPFPDGMIMWPWDQVLWYRSFNENSFKCRKAKMQIIWCESDPDHVQYFAPRRLFNGERRPNSCVVHPVTPLGGGNTSGLLRDEIGQLWYCAEGDECDFSNGVTPDSVNAIDVTVCDKWASDEARAKFYQEMLSDAFW